MSTMRDSWPRRTWLQSQALNVAALAAWSPRSTERCATPGRWQLPDATDRVARVAAQAERLDPTLWQALAQQAVDAARTAGARYADARLTRVVQHQYMVYAEGLFEYDTELLGVGVRALVDGYWGFSASTVVTPDAVVRLARDAVAQAKENAKGPPRAVDFGTVPVATGTWSTPIRIDPFTIAIEEKLDVLDYWIQCGFHAGFHDSFESEIGYVRQERLVATSEGALFTQTLYESGGQIFFVAGSKKRGREITVLAHGLDVAAKGWELFLDARIPDQMPQLRQEWLEIETPSHGEKPSTVGRYTLVCDGGTMASLVGATLGVATQLDRALGYEANAGGTSFIDDPLAMVGQLPVASPVVTVTANRSALAEPATVQWDDEGVRPESYTLIKDGVLVDFQTTREQAAWLAPYYQKHSQPVRSHGCAAAESAHLITMQQMPNLALEPSPSAIRLEDLVADVTNGILIEGGDAECDFQARTGLLFGKMREITNGRVGRALTGGAVLFTTEDLWKHVTAVGGAPTQMARNWTQYKLPGGVKSDPKGQPAQRASYGVRAAAAIITNQPLIDPSRKA